MRKPTSSDHADFDHQDELTPLPGDLPTSFVYQYAAKVDRNLSARITDVRNLIDTKTSAQGKDIADLRLKTSSIEQSLSEISRSKTDEKSARQEDRNSLRWILGIVLTATVTLTVTTLNSCIQQREEVAKIKAGIEILQKGTK
jgi:hypothetical protein